MVIGTCIYFSFHRLTDCKRSRRKEAFSRVALTPVPTLLCGPLLPSPLRKDLRSWRLPGPSVGGSCPNSSTPSGSDFPGFSFGFCGYREGAGTRPGPNPHADRGQPPQICTGPLDPTAPRPHLSCSLRAAEARGAWFPQGAPLGLRQEALAVQRGLDEARIAVELHQVEDLRDGRWGSEPKSQTRPRGLTALSPW